MTITPSPTISPTSSNEHHSLIPHVSIPVSQDHIQFDQVPEPRRSNRNIKQRVWLSYYVVPIKSNANANAANIVAHSGHPLPIVASTNTTLSNAFLSFTTA